MRGGHAEPWAGAKLKAWHAVRAKERQLAGLKKGAAPVVADSPEREEGRARDQAARAVGVGGKLIDQAESVAHARTGTGTAQCCAVLMPASTAPLLAPSDDRSKNGSVLTPTAPTAG